MITQNSGSPFLLESTAFTSVGNFGLPSSVSRLHATNLPRNNPSQGD